MDIAASASAYEATRLAALYRYRILDTPSEAAFDDLTYLAAAICQTPVALISLVDRDRQWFKSRIGMTTPETPRAVAFCAHAILDDHPLIVPDTRQDPRFATNPLVTHEPNMRFYGGAPLITHAGDRLGTLCVIDYVPRQLSAEQIRALQTLSRQVMTQLELRLSLQDHQQAEVAMRQQEALLESTQQQLQHLLDSSPAMIYSCSALGDCRTTYISHNVLSICGYSPQDFINNPSFWLDHIHPQDLPQTQTRLTQLLECDHLTYEYRFLHKDGSYRWTQDSLKLIRSATGEPLEIVGCWQDVTERKQAELALKASEEHFRLLVEGAKDYAIYLLGPNGSIISWNAGAERLTGYTIEEILGLHVSQFYSDLAVQQGQPELNLTTAIAQGWVEDEGWRIRKDGSRFWANVLLSALYDEAGQLRGFSKVVRDITEKKQIEQQFLRAQRLESLGTLAGGIAHDLNNVLAPILMAAQLLRLQVSDSPGQQWVDIVEASARRGADLVRQVLSFARGMEGERVLLELQHLLLEIQQIIGETFPKSITLAVNIDPQLWTICADATQMHQVAMNLCVNARDAMPQGGKLTIRAENLVVDEYDARMQMDLTPGPYVRLTVSDTGTGIAPEILDRVFEPFFTTKEVGKGTGMGLSTTLGIVKGHGGVITVSSQLGQGSDFRVYLPALEVPAAAREVPQGLPQGQGELILVIDDEAPIREITQSLLEQHGYRVLLASDGIEAIILYVQQQAEIAVALVDMMMPTMDGATTIHALQKINPAIKTIAMSGLVTNQQLAEPVRAAIQTFLAKPFTAKELLSSLAQVLAPVRV